MPLPRVRPIIPTSRNEPFDDPEWLFEFKYDGFRALYHLERGRHRLISRRGNILDRFAALGEPMAAELAVPNGSTAISQALSVHGRGRELFELMRDHDLEGIVAKRLGRSLRAAHERGGIAGDRYFIDRSSARPR